ncbi:hypothetical protein [Streptomyces lonarensis]|uniref:Uncharacterized protein n=1 Tax=Streptomyces lonarensis TaxID=700599 RepID=A0A7X6HX75_9ACTN|nr:hypothetical protein [Streptomyces lonarensis]NJQ04256.1 hypothetical protein [Streptomyces lonarensis]
MSYLTACVKCGSSNVDKNGCWPCAARMHGERACLLAVFEQSRGSIRGHAPHFLEVVDLVCLGVPAMSEGELRDRVEALEKVARGNRHHAELLAGMAARAYAVLDNRPESETADELAARLRAALDEPSA